MKIQPTLRYTGLFILLLIVSIGCQKKLDTHAVITVLDQNNSTVATAQVTLYGSGVQGDGVINKVSNTNSEGEAIFNFNDEYQLGQAGFAVLDITVEKNGVIATGIIKVEPETTTYEFVMIAL